MTGGNTLVDQPSEGRKKKAQNMFQWSRRQSGARWQLSPTLPSSSVRHASSAAFIW